MNITNASLGEQGAFRQQYNADWNTGAAQVSGAIQDWSATSANIIVTTLTGNPRLGAAVGTGLSLGYSALNQFSGNALGVSNADINANGGSVGTNALWDAGNQAISALQPFQLNGAQVLTNVAPRSQLGTFALNAAREAAPLLWNGAMDTVVGSGYNTLANVGTGRTALDWSNPASILPTLANNFVSDASANFAQNVLLGGAFRGAGAADNAFSIRNNGAPISDALSFSVGGRNVDPGGILSSGYANVRNPALSATAPDGGVFLPVIAEQPRIGTVGQELTALRDASTLRLNGTLDLSVNPSTVNLLANNPLTATISNVAQGINGNSLSSATASALDPLRNLPTNWRARGQVELAADGNGIRNVGDTVLAARQEAAANNPVSVSTAAGPTLGERAATTTRNVLAILADGANAVTTPFSQRAAIDFGGTGWLQSAYDFAGRQIDPRVGFEAGILPPDSAVKTASNSANSFVGSVLAGGDAALQKSIADNLPRLNDNERFVLDYKKLLDSGALRVNEGRLELANVNIRPDGSVELTAPLDFSYKPQTTVSQRLASGVSGSAVLGQDMKYRFDAGTVFDRTTFDQITNLMNSPANFLRKASPGKGETSVEIVIPVSRNYGGVGPDVDASLPEPVNLNPAYVSLPRGVDSILDFSPGLTAREGVDTRSVGVRLSANLPLTLKASAEIAAELRTDPVKYANARADIGDGWFDGANFVPIRGYVIDNAFPDDETTGAQGSETVYVGVAGAVQDLGGLSSLAAAIDASATPPANSTAASSQDAVTVRAGDTLWSIAERYYGEGQGGRFTDILAANGLDPSVAERLQPGQRLVLPPR
jgi:LysM repeat protein